MDLYESSTVIIGATLARSQSYSKCVPQLIVISQHKDGYASVYLTDVEMKFSEVVAESDPRSLNDVSQYYEMDQKGHRSITFSSNGFS